MKWAVFGLLLLTGCDRPVAVKLSQDVNPSSVAGRYVVLPISGSTIVHEAAGEFLTSAWRLDTMTGALEMCNYGEFTPKTIGSTTIGRPNLVCLASAKANPE